MRARGRLAANFSGPRPRRSSLARGGGATIRSSGLAGAIGVVAALAGVLCATPVRAQSTPGNEHGGVAICWWPFGAPGMESSPAAVVSAAPNPFYVKVDSPEARLYGASGATWLTGADGERDELKRVLAAASHQHQIPVFVQYGIPGRDKSGPSAGGAATLAAYYERVEAYARLIGTAEAVVVIEPDALALGLDPAEVRGAVVGYRTFCPNAHLYVDAGHPAWRSPQSIAPLLVRAGVAQADGFSINVSAYQWTRDCLEWGDRVLAAVADVDPALKGLHYVIDTSRNGQGPGLDERGALTWGDPGRAANGQAISNGPLPTVETGNLHCAAFLWVKSPGYGDNRTHPATHFGGTAWVRPDPHAAVGPR